ncbi:hypothetical protein [Pararhodospirillum photometricum]|nr:hypothetical protein [Pararhodospirillum photometricum]
MMLDSKRIHVLALASGLLLLAGFPAGQASAPTVSPIFFGQGYVCADGTHFTVAGLENAPTVSLTLNENPPEVLAREPTGQLSVYSNARHNLYPEKTGISLGRYKKGLLYTTFCQTPP